MLFNAREIGLDWQGSLETLSSVQSAKCTFATFDGTLKDPAGKVRCKLVMEEIVADNTFGKLVWAKRTLHGETTDYLVKRPKQQNQTKQEVVIQWLSNKLLSQYGFGMHCPRVMDVFTKSDSIWFSMEPIYNAPILDAYMQSLASWGSPRPENGISLLKILAQIAVCCHILEKEIGFNHRDLKPDNIMIKTDRVQTHVLRWKNQYKIHIASSPTAILVDFGFSCLGPGDTPWIQAGDGVLTPLDACPKVGRDIFMLLVFLLWRDDVRKSLTVSHLEFFKSSLHLSTGRLSQMMNMNRNPSVWIYMLITEKGFECPALDPFEWLESCSKAFPELVSII